MVPELLTLTGEDCPDDVYAGGTDVARYESTNLPAIRYGESAALVWVKENPLIVAGLIVAAILIIAKIKKGR